MDDSLKALLSSGWEVKAGMWHAPTARGLVPMWSDQTLVGPTPPEADARKHQRIVRASIEPLYKKAWLSWLDGSLRHKSGEFGYSLLATDEQKALSEGTDTGAGFAVPADFSSRIIAVQREDSLVRQAALVLPTTRDLLTLSQWDYNAEWVNEVMTTADTAITPNALSIPIRKARAKTLVSNDLLSDQPALLEWLTQTAGSNLAYLEEQGFVGGNGVNLPLGFMNALVDTNTPPADTGYVGNTVDVTGTTAHTISNTTANLGSASKLITLETSLPDRYRRRARWFTLGATLAKVRGLVDGAGRQIFPSVASPDGRDDMLMAHPVNTSSVIAADGTALARVIGLVDLSQYVVGTRSLLTVRVATEVMGDVDQTQIYIFDRVGGTLGLADAVRIGTVS